MKANLAVFRKYAQPVLALGITALALVVLASPAWRIIAASETRREAVSQHRFTIEALEQRYLEESEQQAVLRLSAGIGDDDITADLESASNSLGGGCHELGQQFVNSRLSIVEPCRVSNTPVSPDVAVISATLSITGGIDELLVSSTLSAWSDLAIVELKVSPQAGDAAPNGQRLDFKIQRLAQIGEATP